MQNNFNTEKPKKKRVHKFRMKPAQLMAVLKCNPDFLNRIDSEEFTADSSKKYIEIDTEEQ